MKKILFALILISSICACSKKEIAQEPQTTGEKQTIYATVNAATKLAYSEVTSGGGAGLTSTWETGDSFQAIQDGTKTVTFTLYEGAGTTSAKFIAETEGVTESTQWTAVLGGAAVSAGSGKEIHCGYMNQTGTLASLSNYNYVKASGTGLKPSFDFAAGTKLSVIFRIKLPEGIKCIEYTPCGYNKVTSGSADIVYLNDSEQNDYSASKTSTITLASASSKNDLVYLAVPALDFSRTYQTYNNNKQNGNLRTGLVLTLMNDNSDNATLSNGTVYEKKITGKEGSIGTIDLSAMTLLSRPKPTDAINIAKNNVVCVAHSSALKQAGNVDTYWSPFNLGASKVSEAGYYVAFGEAFDNGVYTFVKYSMRHKTDGTNNRDDYCSTQHAKFVENGNNTKFYTVAGSRYDAARVVWGSAWRMPYMIELSVLYNATMKVEKIDGHDCITFTEGGSSISVPIAGYKKEENAAKDETTLFLRSADKINRAASNAGWNAAYGIYIKNTLNTKAMDRWDHYAGLNIRPVLAKSTIK